MLVKLLWAFPAKLAFREHHIRESWIKAMEARLVRKELEKCQRTEGVNHYENCHWLSEKYLTMLKENKVRESPHEKIYKLSNVLACAGEGLQDDRCVSSIEATLVSHGLAFSTSSNSSDVFH